MTSPDSTADRLARDLAPRLVGRATRSEVKRRRSLRSAVEDLQQLRQLPPESVRPHAALIEKALTADCPHLCREALETLAHALGADSTPRLLTALGSTVLGSTASHLLPRLGDAAPTQNLVDLLRDSHEIVRANAARALGLLRRNELLPILVSVLSDPSPDVRVEVVGALAKSGGRRAIPLLIRCLEDEAPSVRKEAVQLLGQLSAEEAVPTLERLLREDPHTEMREWETWIGPRLDDQGVAAVYPIREAAADALEKILSRCQVPIGACP